MHARQCTHGYDIRRNQWNSTIYAPPYQSQICFLTWFGSFLSRKGDLLVGEAKLKLSRREFEHELAELRVKGARSAFWEGRAPSAQYVQAVRDYRTRSMYR